jgi:hypothetical protein
MKYPSQLRILDIRLETLSKSFLDGIRKNARNLRELTITFTKVDEQLIEQLSQF